MSNQELVLRLDDGSAVLARVGGKGASLARLAAAGLPVPAGFHVTTEAYRRFVAAGGLQERIMAAVAGAAAGDPASLAAASAEIGRLFQNHPLPGEIAAAVRQAYAELGGGDLPVAVRSSATAEDLPDLSFAGQQESYLNMRGEPMVLDAVRRCWASLWTARAIDYRARHGIAPDEVSLAVVVQQLVPADAAGVMFTVNPLSGVRNRVVINAAWGLGEAIVGGQVTPDTYVLDKASGALVEQQISQKLMMTVRTDEGTHEAAVPADQAGRPVLSPAQAAELARIGVAIEQLYDQPMDIEWAMAGGQCFIVQARPITTLRSEAPATEEWNDSLTGEYLWTNANLGEAVPDVMTPCTWSLVQLFMTDAMATSSIPPYLGYGNIGGRFYMNLSMAAALAGAFGVSEKRFLALTGDVFGRLPAGWHIPPVRLSRWRIIRLLLPIAVRVLRRVPANAKRLADFLATAPERCDELHRRINATTDPAALAKLWQTDVEPFFHECCLMLEAAGRQDSGALVTVRGKLQKLVGEVEANALTSGFSGGNSPLASLGPLLGLTRLAKGEIDRVTFARQWGHRGAHEFEVSLPRPAEDPAWIEKQLAGLRAAREDATVLLARQEQESRAAWERLRQRYPRQAEPMRRQIERWTAAAHLRESARSEVMRMFWVLRAFVLRAAALTGQGDALFFLSIHEILAVLRGDHAPLAQVSIRRTTYEGYCALPPYPALIRGRFDPFRWAADPERRSDLFDAMGQGHTAAGSAVTGFAGAAGIVEGRVRVIRAPEEGDQLQPGEILVTTVTNIGWTPLFPRAAAVVTDVGAPLSHAAIVARELGIPAVVGCGNATMRLHTGDRVRVDGGRGTVELL